MTRRWRTPDDASAPTLPAPTLPVATGRAVPGDEGLAILFVLMCVMISMALTLGLLGVLLSELAPTVHQRKSARTIAASQAGLQAGLAMIRTASTTTAGVGTFGDRQKLPCYTAGSPLTGSVGGIAGNLAYSVQVRYYTMDPANQTAAWRNSNALTCTPGAGTAVTPLYALVQAAATGDSVGPLGATWGNRSSEIVYTFNRTDQAFLGGLIHTGRGTTSTDLCWQAPSATPAAGQTITLATCVPGKDTQTFSYRSDYTIVLSGTQSATTPPSGGMCVYGTPSPASLTFQSCSSPVPWQQKWSYNDDGQLEGVRSDMSSLSGYCIGTGGVYTVGRTLTVEACGMEWNPEATVGAGASGTATSQLINYSEYGRCLDVTNQNVNYAWLIDYPCKQDPTRPVTWNQRFIWDSGTTKQIQTNPGSLYCLTTAASAGGYVLVKPCVNGQANQQWTMYGDTGNRTTSYTVVDTNGRCLSLGPPGTTSGSLSQWSSITADVCDGSLKQMWNAPRLPIGGTLGGEREPTTG